MLFNSLTVDKTYEFILSTENINLSYNPTSFKN